LSPGPKGRGQGPRKRLFVIAARTTSQSGEKRGRRKAHIKKKRRSGSSGNGKGGETAKIFAVLRGVPCCPKSTGEAWRGENGKERHPFHGANVSMAGKRY